MPSSHRSRLECPRLGARSTPLASTVNSSMRFVVGSGRLFHEGVRFGNHSRYTGRRCFPRTFPAARYTVTCHDGHCVRRGRVNRRMQFAWRSFSVDRPRGNTGVLGDWSQLLPDNWRLWHPLIRDAPTLFARPGASGAHGGGGSRGPHYLLYSLPSRLGTIADPRGAAL